MPARPGSAARERPARRFCGDDPPRARRGRPVTVHGPAAVRTAGSASESRRVATTCRARPGTPGAAALPDRPPLCAERLAGGDGAAPGRERRPGGSGVPGGSPRRPACAGGPRAARTAGLPRRPAARPLHRLDRPHMTGRIPGAWAPGRRAAGPYERTPGHPAAPGPVAAAGPPRGARRRAPGRPVRGRAPPLPGRPLPHRGGGPFAGHPRRRRVLRRPPPRTAPPGGRRARARPDDQRPEALRYGATDPRGRGLRRCPGRRARRWCAGRSPGRPCSR